MDRQEQGENAISLQRQPEFPRAEAVLGLELRPGAWPRAAWGGVGRVLRDGWNRTQIVLRSSSLHQAREGEAGKCWHLRAAGALAVLKHLNAYVRTAGISATGDGIGSLSNLSLIGRVGLYVSLPSSRPASSL